MLGKKNKVRMPGRHCLQSIMAVVLSLALALTPAGITGTTKVQAGGGGVNYLDAEGSLQNTGDNTVTKVLSTTTSWSAGWYYVDGTVEISDRIACSGAVNLILTNGATLTASKGITVSGDGNSLTIYAQSKDESEMGKLVATGNNSGAGIGGGAACAGSNIIINGGTVTATGGNGGAGIGGGAACAGSNITINGGTVTATGGGGGAGIGGGSSGGAGSNIEITGGTVTATGGTDAAGIGGGDCGGDGSNITITGGTVTATGVNDAAGIGGGMIGDCSDITISGGTVTAIGGTNAVGIGGGFGHDGSNVTITNLAVKAGSSAADATDITYSSYSDIKSKRYVYLTSGTAGDPTPTSDPVKYLAPKYDVGRNIQFDTDGNVIFDADKECADYTTVTESVTTWGSAGAATWYVVAGTVTISSRITCKGSVNLILGDGATLTSVKGITVSGDGNSLTIYGQSDGTGKLTVKAPDYSAAIGGEDNGAGGNITINGGTI